ncbi:MAG: AraC family ligand binding domain-containing protein [Dysgonomonas sp.]|uniref:AraC family ligand binding domain-containing protein n=1 Tax=Dysgonomonas sp. TaxID=1891233 RepID=UPI003A84D889
MMNKIPKHIIATQFDGQIAKLKYLSGDNYLPAADYAHRDDYYIFFFMEKGEARLLIDFKEYDIKANTVYYILPEQVHFITDYSKDASAWALIVDRSLVKDEYKEIFERSSLFKNIVELDKTTIDDLQSCISILERRLNLQSQPIGQNILYDLLSLYVGMIAEVYQRDFPIPVNKRIAIITF